MSRPSRRAPPVRPAVAAPAAAASGVVPIAVASYYGRIGNNLLQYAHAMYAGEHTGLPVRFPPHSLPLLARLAGRTHPHPSPSPAGVNRRPAPAASLRSARYFYKADVERLGVPAPTTEQMRDLFVRRIAPLLVPPETTTGADDGVAGGDPDRTLVAHIRSGDLFQGASPHPEYWQPPVYWYEQVAAQHRREHGADAPLVAVTEPDLRNPVVAELGRRGWQVVSRSIDEDFVTLLRARYLACSYGTFSMTAALASEHARVVYVPHWDAPRRHGLASWAGDPAVGLEVRAMHLPGYAGEPWRNTPAQRQFMVQYTPPRLK